MSYFHAIQWRRAACAFLLPAVLAGATDLRGAEGTLSERIEAIRAKHGVPALAGAIVTTNGLLEAVATGFRKKGDDSPATVDDLWHLGSNTKAMTAALCGRLVERGLLRWDTTVSDAFPDDAPSFHPDSRGITLLQLLTHRAGVAANLDWAGLSRSNTVRVQRLEATRKALSSAPAFPPGSRVSYANTGYVVAGAMVEKALDRPWEDAIRDELFRPLGIAGAGFGGTGTEGRADQPWPHTENGNPLKRNGPATDNPPVLGPAGRVHAALADWSRFVADQLNGAAGRPALLRPETFRRLHEPEPGGTAAAGWFATEREWGGGRVLSHNGSNRMNFSVAWLAPSKGFAAIVCCNQGGGAAEKACDEAASALIGWYRSAHLGH